MWHFEILFGVDGQIKYFLWGSLSMPCHLDKQLKLDKWAIIFIIFLLIIIVVILFFITSSSCSFFFGIFRVEVVKTCPFLLAFDFRNEYSNQKSQCEYYLKY